jgi:hypothetical protein
MGIAAGQEQPYSREAMLDRPKASWLAVTVAAVIGGIPLLAAGDDASGRNAIYATRVSSILRPRIPTANSPRSCCVAASLKSAREKVSFGTIGSASRSHWTNWQLRKRNRPSTPTAVYQNRAFSKLLERSGQAISDQRVARLRRAVGGANSFFGQGRLRFVCQEKPG